MAGVRRFEDLIAWQKARSLTKEVFLATSREPMARHFRLAGQLESAAVSVMSNIAEGFERDSVAEFHRFLTIAKASCGEVRSLLYVVEDANLTDAEALDRLRGLTAETNRVVYGLRSSVERRKQSIQERWTINEDGPEPYLHWLDQLSTEH
jgi:four helix bundle protein